MSRDFVIEHLTALDTDSSSFSSNTPLFFTMLDGIDVTQIPGYIVPTDDLPEWRRTVIDKRNKELVEVFVASRRAEQEESNKWSNMPEWKQRLAKQREQKRLEELAPSEEERKRRQLIEEKEAAMPEWKRCLLEKKRQSISNNSTEQ